MSPSPGNCWTPSRSGSPPARRGEVNGTTRNRLAAFDATSGNLSIAFKLVVYNGGGGPDAVLSPHRAYVDRRTKEGLSKPEIMRCIKCYLAREVYHALVADLEAVHAT